MAEPANIETVILSGILHDKEYMRKVMPHILSKFFADVSHKTVWDLIYNYNSKYSALPTKDAIEIELSNQENLSQTVYEESIGLIDKIYSEKAKEAVEKSSKEWLTETTEKYCLNRSVRLAVVDAIDIIDGDNKTASADALPDMLQKALAVSFDSDIGHDYFEDFEKRYEFYHAVDTKYPFPISALNTITKGGTMIKTLNMMIMPTGVGKTHWMTYLSSFYLKQGYDVLYVTLEMAEERISERVDACLLDIDMDGLKGLPKEIFERKLNKVKSKTNGKLIVKEYPPGSISVNHLRFLLDELKSKKNFKPTIIFVDYINLMVSTRLRNSENSYLAVKYIAEELRGLMVEREMMGWSASQTNRAGQGAADFDLTEVSESHGLSMTADFILAGILTDDLEKLGQLRLKILKSRYGPKASFIVGMDRGKMTFHDLDSVSDAVVNAPTQKTNNSNPLKTNNSTKEFKFN